MGASEREDLAIYRAIINHEEQYSLWLAEEVWTDMRPLGLRGKMEGL